MVNDDGESLNAIDDPFALNQLRDAEATPDGNPSSAFENSNYNPKVLLTTLEIRVLKRLSFPTAWV